MTATPETDRQRTVQRYVEAYCAGRLDDAVQVFTEDVRWIVLGAFDVRGRDAYLASMTNDQIEGWPDIRVTSYFEDGDSVVVEGTVAQALVGGAVIDVNFLDVFRFRGEHVCEKRSYAITSQPFSIEAQ